VKGIVVGTDASSGEVTLDTDAIPGFMEAMTMPYKLKDPSVLPELHPGDRITAVLHVGDHTTLDQIVVTAQAKPDYKPQTQYHVPEKGDPVPDFRLTDQDGRALRLSHFRGRTLLLTFIYTRCPLSDYCPRMSRNFAWIDARLRADPALYRRTHLLSISFDPAYDSPAVLRSYGEAVTGGFTRERFEHWSFAAPRQEDLPKLLAFFDVGVTPGESHTLNHSLSTAVIGPDGRVVAWYPTNDWDPAEVLAAVRRSAAPSGAAHSAEGSGQHATGADGVAAHAREAA
jgi:protein SCO1/2